MLREMRPSELGAWAALWTIDPWGETRADLRSGMISAVIANVNRDPKRRAQPFSAADFMPYVKAEERADAEDLSKRLRAAMMAAPTRSKKR